MKKFTVLILILAFVLSGCTGRGTLEETDVNASATVEDKRTNTPTSPLTGRKILSPATFTVNDPENKRGLSSHC